jgi:hypothetical protein
MCSFATSWKDSGQLLTDMDMNITDQLNSDYTWIKRARKLPTSVLQHLADAGQPEGLPIKSPRAAGDNFEEKKNLFNFLINSNNLIYFNLKSTQFNYLIWQCWVKRTYGQFHHTYAHTCNCHKHKHQRWICIGNDTDSILIIKYVRYYLFFP